MKIVIISSVIFPRISPRANRVTELAKEFSRLGHHVILYGILGTYCYQSFEEEHNIRVENLGKPLFFPITSDNAKPNINLFKQFLNRSLKNIIDYPNIELAFLANKVLKKEDNIDLLITSAIPHSIHWGTAFRKQRNSNIAKTWVADCGDPFMGNPFHKPLFYFKYLEKYFCEQADFISIPIESAKQAYYKEFWDKIRIIPQGFDFKDIPISKTNKDKCSTPTFLYAGTFYSGVRDPRPLLDYLLTKKEVKDFRFLIFTNSIHILEPYIKKLNEKIIISNFVPREDLLKKMKEVNFVINFENNNQFQAPSKLIDYAIMKKPILSINSNEVLDESLIDDFLNGNYSRALYIDNIEQYKIENVANLFLSLAEKVKK